MWIFFSATVLTALDFRSLRVLAQWLHVPQLSATNLVALKKKSGIWCCQPVWQLYLQSSWGLLKSPEEWFCFTIHLAVHAFDILTCNPGYTESLDSFLALSAVPSLEVLPMVKPQRGKSGSWREKKCELNYCWASLCILVTVKPP